MSKEDKDTIRKTGAYFAPLLEGNIQFGRLRTTHNKYAMNELRLRNVSSLSNKSIRVLAAKIKESEFLG